MFFRGLGNLSPDEQVLYKFWYTKQTLLELGIPWDAIERFTEGEMSVVLAVSAARSERQQEQEAQVQRSMQMKR